MLGIDVGFVLAVAALGWGLSLATYRLFAKLYFWPMGDWQAKWPFLPLVIGAACALLGVLFAGVRGYAGFEVTAWAIPAFGVAWAVFWTGFLRVGAQSALLLAPAAAGLLLWWWLS